MRDITLEDTFYALFTTRSFSTGAPAQLAGTPVVSAYENESLTQITAGITLGVDHDSVTGLNLLTVAATAANGYENGKDYALVITTGTVGGVSVVGEVVAEFTIGRSAAAVDLANGTDGLGAIKAETAAILDDTDLIDDGTSGLAKIATDVAAVLVDTAEIGAAGAGLTAINLPDQTMNITGDITGNLSGSVGSVSGDIGGIAAGGLTADAIANDLRDMLGAMVSTTIATLASQVSFTLTAGSADDDAYNGATIVVTDASTNAQKAIGVISDYTGSSKTVTLASDPGIFTMATSDIVNIFPTASVLGVWDRVLSGTTHNLANSAGRRLRQLEGAFVVHSGTAAAGAAGTITLDAGASATNDIYNGDRIIIVAGTGVGEHGIVTDYVGSTKVATMSKNWVVTPDATSEFDIVPADVDVETWANVTVTSSSTTALPEVDAKSISDDATAADNAEAFFDGTGYAGTNNVIPTVTTLTGHTPQTGDSYARLGAPAGASVSEDIATVDTVVDGIQADLDNGTDGLGAIKTQTAAIETDTQDIQGRIPTALSPDGFIDANLMSVNDDATTVTILEALMDGGMLAQVNDASALNTAFAADGFTEATDDHFNGRLITFVTGNLRYQQTDITDYDAAGGAQGNQQFNVTALTEAPANDDFFVIH